MSIIADAPVLWPAICSAVAAAFSAFASGILLWIQLDNRRDSVRPEIVPDDWSFDRAPRGVPGWASIRIKKLRNIGKGSARHIRGEAIITGAKPMEQGGPFVGLFYESIPVVPADQEIPINWECQFQWENSTLPGSDLTPITLTVFVHDLHGRRYEIVHALYASSGIGLFGATTLAPGLAVTQIYTKIIPNWSLRLRSHKQKVLDAAAKLQEQVRRRSQLPQRIKDELEKRGLLDRWLGKKDEN